MNFWKVADLWHSLMVTTLGYEKYAAGGCDVGALVTGQLGINTLTNCMQSISGLRKS